MTEEEKHKLNKHEQLIDASQQSYSQVRVSGFSKSLIYIGHLTLKKELSDL